MRMIYQVAFSGPIQQAARTVRQSVSQSGWSVASRCEHRTKHDRRGDYFWILNHRGASRPIIGCAFGLVCLRFCEVQAVVGFDSWIRDWSAPLFFAHVVVSRRRITQPMWKLIWPTIFPWCLFFYRSRNGFSIGGDGWKLNLHTGLFSFVLHPSNGRSGVRVTPLWWECRWADTVWS